MTRKKAFTLAEVLVTLGVIGVVAALTMPSVMNNVKKLVLKNQFKKTYSLMSNAYRKAQADLEFVPRCYYWDKNPYGGVKCESYSPEGECNRWVMSDDTTPPDEINGPTEDCSILGQAVIKNLKIIKTCENSAYAKGCVPDYDGSDTIKKSSDDTLGDYEITQATTACRGWRKSNILNRNSAYVLADGQILISYSTMLSSAKLFAVDINGMKGPNKWGHDLFVFAVKGSNNNMFIGGNKCEVVDEKGITTNKMLLEMNK